MDHGLTTAQADALEQLLTDELQLSAELRVESAGYATACAAWDLIKGRVLRLPDSSADESRSAQDAAQRQIAILAGPGRIGATALVAARRLLAWGVRPIVLLGAARDQLLPLAAAEADRFELLNGRIFEPGTPLPAADLWIDGVFGSHFHEPLSDELKDLIDAVNHDQARTLAIDLPTGLDATTGKASLPTIRADVTLALGYPMVGALKSFAAQLVGTILVADVGIPTHFWRKVGVMEPVHFDGQAYVEWQSNS